jgi:FKBP-type peptidyl-prolyl cis-trans isomerase
MQNLSQGEKVAVWVAVIIAAIVFIAFGFFQRQIVETQNSSLFDVNLEDQPMENSGELMVEDVIVGEGEEVEEGDTVTVHYVGKFEDGTTFDSSVDRGEPFSFTVGNGQVIAGWEQGVLEMREGGVRKLTIPPSLGYGPQDYGPIPGNSTLNFEIRLLEILE